MPPSTPTATDRGGNTDEDGAADADGSTNGPSSSTSATLPCPDCGQTFRRREHLSRHRDRHSGSRSHTCSICKRTFSRRDTLKRHVRTHGAAALEEWTQNNNDDPSSRDHRRTACEACARGKLRCDGRNPVPCSNCTNKGRRCSYRPTPVDDETIVVVQPTPDVDLPAALSPPRQLPPPVTSQSCVSDQFSLEQALLWDTLLTPAQFLFPFSPVPSLGTGTPTDFAFGDNPLAATGPPPDDHGAQNSSGANGTAKTGVQAVRAPAESGSDSLTPEEEDILVAEYVPHVPPLTAETRAHAIQALKDRLPQHEGQGLDGSFPSLRHLDTYMQLYFEHFHPRMPILHVPTFQASPETWQLVVGVVCLGSQYSSAHSKPDHVLLLQRIAQHMLKRDVRELSNIDILTCAQSLLLFQQSIWFSGERNLVVELQFYRNVLVTLCRQLLSREGTLMRTHTSTQTDDVNHAWFRWIRAEAKRRIVYFTWMSECFQATFFMLPPLLSVAELQSPTPGADLHWSSNHDQWHRLPPPRSSSPLCALLARVGLGDVTPASLEQSAKSTTLLSAFVQQAAEGDVLRAMNLGSLAGGTAGQPEVARGTVATLSEKAFDALSQAGCSQPLRETDAGTISTDFALLARVLAVISFTPLRLLYPYSKWQTTEEGHSDARSELSRILSENLGRARRCLYHAAQVFQYFRTARVATCLDILCVLICALYMVLYVDMVEQQQHDPDSAGGDGGAARTSGAEIIRLDHAVDADLLNEWLEVGNRKTPHITGVGLLRSGRAGPRLYKEASRIMASGSSVSRMAREMATILESQAKGCAPDF